MSCPEQNELEAVLKNCAAPETEQFLAKHLETCQVCRERLDSLVSGDGLMRLARAEQVSGSQQVGLSATESLSTDLGDVIGERIAFWQPVADRQHQTLTDAHDSVPEVRLV